MKSFINKKYTYAIVGASANKEKYGYKILEFFLDAGFTTIPVNPKSDEILGQRVYKNLDEITQRVDVVIFVVPPSVTESVIEDVKKQGINKVWLQPGSESATVISFCKHNNIECYHSACIMIEQLKYLS